MVRLQKTKIEVIHIINCKKFVWNWLESLRTQYHIDPCDV